MEETVDLFEILVLIVALPKKINKQGMSIGQCYQLIGIKNSIFCLMGEQRFNRDVINAFDARICLV